MNIIEIGKIPQLSQTCVVISNSFSLPPATSQDALKVHFSLKKEVRLFGYCINQAKS